MSPEERQLLAALFERTRSAANAARDRDAESFIDAAIREQPYAPYLLAQAVVLQEKGLEAASARIRDLEDHVARLQQGQNSAAPAESGGFLGGLGSIFGHAPEQPRPPQPQAGDAFAQTVDRDSRQGRLYDDYDRNNPPQRSAPWGQQQPQYDPRMAAPAPAAGPWGQATSGGGGFLKGALGAAAGVAGGVLLADTLRGAFGSHMSGLGLGSPFGLGATGQPPVEETVVNNYYVDDNRQPSDNTDADPGFDDTPVDDSDDSDYV